LNRYKIILITENKKIFPVSIITQVIIEIRALPLVENGVIFRYNHLHGGEYSRRTNFLNLMKESAIQWNTKHATKFGMTLFKGKM